MLTGWWERLRGYDSWDDVDVVVRSTESWGVPSFRRSYDFQGRQTYWTTVLKPVTVDYKSGVGAVHRKTVWLFCCPNLFVLGPGDHFYVRCSPNAPDRLYIRENALAVQNTIIGLSIGALVFIWSKHLFR